jgi:hypothetical protein
MSPLVFLSGGPSRLISGEGVPGEGLVSCFKDLLLFEQQNSSHKVVFPEGCARILGESLPHRASPPFEGEGFRAYAEILQDVLEHPGDPEYLCGFVMGRPVPLKQKSSNAYSAPGPSRLQATLMLYFYDRRARYRLLYNHFAIISNF